MSQQASLGCRFCFVDSHVREKLDVVMAVTSRFHFNTMRMIEKQESGDTDTRKIFYPIADPHQVLDCEANHCSPATRCLVPKVSSAMKTDEGMNE